MLMLLVWGIFLLVFASVVGAYWVVVVVPESRGQAVLRRRLTREGPMRAEADLLKKPEVLSSIGGLNTALNSVGHLLVPLKLTIDQSGMHLTVGTFLLLTTTSFLTATMAVITYTRLWWLGVLMGVGAALIPMFVVNRARTRRIHKFEEQFPEAVELIARAMRAGHAFSTGIKMAADELTAPAGTEFKILYERQNFGAQLTDALKSFADRVPSLDARFFVTAVLTQREAGGNLAEVLDRLASVMRERFNIKREVRVRSAHGRITALVLAGMPPAIAGMMLFTNSEALKILTTDPLGIRMVEVAVALQIVGMLVVRKLVDIEY